jgi:hypothetical protein
MNRRTQTWIGNCLILALPPAFAVLVIFFGLLAPIAVCALVLLGVAEVRGSASRHATARFACWAWLALTVPTFGIMPLLMAGRWHFRIPLGNTLGIFTGITLSWAYDLLWPTPELWQSDHPFPPIGRVGYAAVGALTLGLALLPVDVLWQLRRLRRKRAAEQCVAPEPAQRGLFDTL